MINVVMQYFKSKTVLFGLLLAFVGWLQAVLVGAPLPPEVVGFLSTAIGAVIIWLRSVTTVPIDEK
jgi:VIT1/CCC1 family predicted Fe2+/Mn2+ transporter